MRLFAAVDARSSPLTVRVGSRNVGDTVTLEHLNALVFGGRDLMVVKLATGLLGLGRVAGKTGEHTGVEDEGDGVADESNGVEGSRCLPVLGEPQVNHAEL